MIILKFLRTVSSIHYPTQDVAVAVAVEFLECALLFYFIQCYEHLQFYEWTSLTSDIMSLCHPQKAAKHWTLPFINGH